MVVLESNYYSREANNTVATDYETWWRRVAVKSNERFIEAMRREHPEVPFDDGTKPMPVIGHVLLEADEDEAPEMEAPPIVWRQHAKPKVVIRTVTDIVRNVANEVARKHGLSDLEYLTSKRRTQGMARARQEVMAELRKLGWSLPRIGRIMNRDHSTISHGINMHRAREAGHASQ